MAKVSKKKIWIWLTCICLLLGCLAVVGFIWKTKHDKAAKINSVVRSVSEDDKKEFDIRLDEIEKNKPDSDSSPADQYQYYYTKAQFLAGMGEYQQSIDTLKQVSAIKGLMLGYGYYNVLGDNYTHLGEFDNAILNYQKAIDLIESDNKIPDENKSMLKQDITAKLEKLK